MWGESSVESSVVSSRYIHFADVSERTVSISLHRISSVFDRSSSFQHWCSLFPRSSSSAVSVESSSVNGNHPCSCLDLSASKTLNGVFMTITGALIGGPANMISAAITADLGRQEVLAASDQALSTVTGIVDGTGSFGAAIGQVFIPIIQKHWSDWKFVFLLLRSDGKMIDSLLSSHPFPLFP